MGRKEEGERICTKLGDLKWPTTTPTTAKLRLQISRSAAVQASSKVIQKVIGEVARAKKRVLATLDVLQFGDFGPDRGRFSALLCKCVTRGIDRKAFSPLY